jgi:integrase
LTFGPISGYFNEIRGNARKRVFVTRGLPSKEGDMAKRLTQISVDNAKPTSSRQEIADAMQPGLYLVIQPTGRKSWAVRYRLGGKSKKHTLAKGISLADARDQAREVLGKVARGVDPARPAAPATVHTFGEVYSDFVKRHVQVNTSEAYRQGVERLFGKYVLPVWASKDIATITRLDINKLLDGVIDRTKAERGDAARGTSSVNVHSMLRSLFGWAVGRGYVDASPVTGVPTPLTLTSRDRVLSEDEISAVWRAAEAAGYPYGTMTQLLLLTGQRRSEVAGMARSEISGNTWIIPSDRTKNGEVHEVPLSEPALEILRSIPKIGNRYVLTHRGDCAIADFARAKKVIDAQLDIDMAHWTFHDLRRTVATGMAKLHIPLQVCEKILNHISGSLGGIAGIYNRHDYADEKRTALQAWGRYVLSLQHPEHNVARLPQRA